MSKDSPAEALSGAAVMSSSFLDSVTGAHAGPLGSAAAILMDSDRDGPASQTREAVAHSATASESHHLIAAMHSISTRAFRASPLAPNALRAGLLVGKKVT